MLPCMIVPSPVSQLVLKGADLMLPGVCRPLTIAAARAAGVNSIEFGDLWAVRVAGNALPIAVGRAVTRAPSLELLGEKGKAIDLMHRLGDSLWNHGKQVVLPPLFTSTQVFSGRDDAELLASCGMGPSESLPGFLAQPELKQQPQQSEASHAGAPAKESEELAYTDAPTPTPVSASPAAAASCAAAEVEDAAEGGRQTCPPLDSGEDAPLNTLESELTVELGKFIQGATKKKLIQTKEQRGIVSVVKINRSHPDYCKHTPVPESQKKKLVERAGASAAATSPTASGAVAAGGEEGTRDAPNAAGTARSGDEGPLVFEFCAPPAKCCRIFAAVEVRTGKNVFFTAEEYRQVLVKYFDVQNAKKEEGEEETQAARCTSGSRENTVAIDPLLADAVLTKEEREEAKAAGQEKLVMDKGEIFVRWMDTAQPCHAVLRDEGELPLLQGRIVRGACNPVRISVEEKQGGRKHLTHIANVTNFLVEPKAVAEFLQKKLAASASVYAPPGSKVVSAVSVQGNVARPVAELMISHFGIPKKFVEVELKKPKKGR
ncbi:hypothetical protein, conserved [Eimeria necatrix]|uniref:SUI1 domain-containing protein n=1 Tax=Eimeria necatrix TaxID=51315 RepID=U6N0J1_9EIME|nr:hypothetical protein, conserved [Eimeria necatrix]CDJ67460.1 hypothetical protein, conserved [Eimeria necatrix]